LKEAGAKVQRPLWASTSTKNPDYPDTKYVDELIGPNTVNTLPEPTLHAFADHGTIACTINKDVTVSRRQWAQLAMNQIDVDEVADQLEREGVASFIQSFEELIHALETKAATL
jgi:transaldolase